MSTKAKLKLTTSEPKPILDTFCLLVPDVSKTPKINDTAWQLLVNPLKPIALEFMTGSQATHGRYIELNANCYNYDPGLEAKRIPPQNIATINAGICNKQYGYGFFQDTLGYMPKLNPRPRLIITINPAEPKILGGNYTSTFSQIDYIIRACSAAGIKIECWQIGYENGIQANADIFPTSQTIFDTTQAIANYIRSKTSEPISGDCNISDDTTCRLKDLNSTMNNLSIEMFRQYFQIDSRTYSDARNRVATFSAFCDLFQQQFPGKQMRIAQALVKPTSGLIGTVAEALLYCEEFFSVINENQKRGDLIRHYSVEIGRCVSGASRLNLCYPFMTMIRGAQQNDGLITAEYVDCPGSENLITIAVKKGNDAEAYIINPTGSEFTLDAVRADGLKKTIHAEANYGTDPLDATSLRYVYDGVSPKLNKYSLTKISTARAAVADS